MKFLAIFLFFLVASTSYAVDFITSAQGSLYERDNTSLIVHTQVRSIINEKNRARFEIGMRVNAEPISGGVFLRNLLATFYHRDNLRQIRSKWRDLGVKESQLPSYLSKGMLKRLMDDSYRPNLNTLLFDFRYRQTLEKLGHPRWAWNLSAKEVRRKLFELNVTPQTDKNALIDVSTFPSFPEIRLRLWASADEREAALRTAMGVLHAVHRYGPFDHDHLMSELSGFDVQAIRTLRRQIRETGSVTFRYFHDDPNSEYNRDFFFKTFKDSYSKVDDHVEGILSMETSGHRPLFVPGESIVVHRMAVENRSVIGKYNPGLVNNYLQEMLAQKWTEYLFWNEYSPGAMSETINVGDLFPQDEITDYKALRRKLNEKFPRGWVLKPVWGYATEEKIITDKTDIDGEIQAYLKSDFEEFAAEIRENYGKEGNFEYLQEELKEHPHFMGWKLHQMFKNNSPYQLIAQERVSIKREYRVEVWGGKILKDATVDRYAYKVEYGEEFTTSTRRQIQGAEAFAEKILNDLPPELRETPWGMDIAELNDGSYIMIESNAGGNSSFVYDVPAAQKGIVALGRFVKIFPKKLARGELTGGLSLEDQRDYMKRMFAKWNIDPKLHFEGTKFLEDRVEFEDYQKRDLNPERWLLVTQKRKTTCADLILAD